METIHIFMYWRGSQEPEMVDEFKETWFPWHNKEYIATESDGDSVHKTSASSIQAKF